MAIPSHASNMRYVINQTILIKCDTCNKEFSIKKSDQKWKKICIGCYKTVEHIHKKPMFLKIYGEEI